jgi:hypothetical protein
MLRWLSWFLVAAAVGAPLGHAARAETLTLDYDLVVHVTELYALDVPGRPGYEVGIANFRGIAVFDDGRIAHHAYAGGFDFIDGSGAFHGYAHWLFEDGSRLDSRYVGTAEGLPDGGIAFTGSHADITGAGAFEGVRGSGTFEGRRIADLEDGGETYHRGRLQLTLPDD